MRTASMRVLSTFAAVMAYGAIACAEGGDRDFIEFDGARYQLSYEDQAPGEDGLPGDGIAEFTIPGETLDDWSKLFAFHAYPQMGEDPLAATRMVGKVVKEKNKDASFAIVANESTGEAIIDFLTWEPESDILEFNVFKYARASDGLGLIAMQYAQHIKLGDIDVAGMRALRHRAVEVMGHTDISQAQAYFDYKRRYSASNAEEVEEPSRARASLDQ